MFTDRYNFNKTRYERTKPIRGRAEDIRPIAKRRRDWETIRANPQPDGTTSYACRLYKTDCVEYFADGRVTLRTDEYATNSTAAFIHAYSPWDASKQHNNIWVRVMGIMYPIPPKGELTFQTTDRGFVPVNHKPVYKRVVDRIKAKQAREPFRPFLNWAKALLSVSDGWIMHETRKTIGEMSWDRSDLVWKLSGFVLKIFPAVRDNCINWAQDEEQYLKLLCYLLRLGDDCDRRLAEGENLTYPVAHYDLKFNFATLQRRVYMIADQMMDIHKVVEAQVGAKSFKNIEWSKGV
jgi:hypothetical protein